MRRVVDEERVLPRLRDVDDAKRVFAALAEGGTVTQALEPTFFSAGFGMCVDRFGTPWMIVAPDPNQAS